MAALTSDALREYVADTYPGLRVSEDEGNWFFIYDPDLSLPSERQMPFATLVISDRYDSVSNLDRPGIYRLNVSMKKGDFLQRFGNAPVESLVADCDFTALDTLMPHPEYGPVWWVCVLNPDSTFPEVQSLLTDAYDRAAGRSERRASRT